MFDDTDDQHCLAENKNNPLNTLSVKFFKN